MDGIQRVTLAHIAQALLSGFSPPCIFTKKSRGTILTKPRKKSLWKKQHNVK